MERVEQIVEKMVPQVVEYVEKIVEIPEVQYAEKILEKKVPQRF